MKYIKHFEKNDKGRDFAVGDIHGCVSKLLDKLKDIGFDQSKDRLFSVGDLVDRGPESERAEELLLYPWFHSVKGNHDDMAERWPEGNMDPVNYSFNGGTWNIGRARDKQVKTANAMAALPYAIEVETSNGLIGVVHAECAFESWSKFRDALNEFDQLSGTKRNAIEGLCMWNRERIKSRLEVPVLDVHAVICGHTPVARTLVLGNVHYIDTGACFGHALTIIDLETLEEVKELAK